MGGANGLSLNPMNPKPSSATAHRISRTLHSLSRWAVSGTLLLSLNVYAAEPAPDLGLPDFGDASASAISPLQEQRMGADFMRALRSSVKIIEDPEITEYIQSLGYRLLAHADPQPYPYTFFIVADTSINAFAGPGGYIGVHSGLILASESESALASVLAHEIAHVTQHHLLRAIDKSNRLALPAPAALIAALILAGQNAQLGQAALATTLASGAQAGINFTRAHELEAGRVGLPILAGAGFDPRSMPAFFEQLQQATRFYESGAPELLRTHPVTTSRIADARARRTISAREKHGYVVLSADARQTPCAHEQRSRADRRVFHEDAARQDAGSGGRAALRRCAGLVGGGPRGCGRRRDRLAPRERPRPHSIPPRAGRDRIGEGAIAARARDLRRRTQTLSTRLRAHHRIRARVAARGAARACAPGAARLSPHARAAPAGLQAACPGRKRRGRAH